MKICSIEVLRLTVDHACFAGIVAIAASKIFLSIPLATLDRAASAVLVEIGATQKVAAGSAD
jgi:hypothetical protein